MTTSKLDTPDIDVIDLELLQNASALKAVATIVYDDTIVYDVRVVHAPGKAPFVAPPQREYWENGQRRWAPVLRWSRKLHEAIEDALLEAYAEELARRSIKRLPVPPCLAVLGVSLPCTAEDVKRAYRQLARKTHPDAGGDPQEFIKIREAYDQALGLMGGVA